MLRSFEITVIFSMNKNFEVTACSSLVPLIIVFPGSCHLTQMNKKTAIVLILYCTVSLVYYNQAPQALLLCYFKYCIIKCVKYSFVLQDYVKVFCPADLTPYITDSSLTHLL